MILALSGLEAALLVGGGLVAGVVNAIAGGGSLLTVPLLVLVGLPGAVANGTNRVGVLAQYTASAARFAMEGISGVRKAIPVLVPVGIGSLVGAVLISRVASDTFERLFGLVMVPLLVLSLWPPRPARADGEPRRWSPTTTAVVFVGLGLYGGAFQVGVGLLLVLALSHSGYDLVTAASIKAVVIAVLVAVSIPVFLAADLIDWVPALVLAVGYSAGGWIGARVAVRGGERVIRPVVMVAVAALAGRMLGLY